MNKFNLRTTKEQDFIDITPMVKKILAESKINQGIVIIFSPHTTAGITINENCDSDVIKDMLNSLEKTYPINGNYRHIEGNSHAHIKTSLMGTNASIIVDNGELALGTWQGIYFCEFDGPRNRQVYVKIIEG